MVPLPLGFFVFFLTWFFNPSYDCLVEVVRIRRVNCQCDKGLSCPALTKTNPCRTNNYPPGYEVILTLRRSCRWIFTSFTSRGQSSAPCSRLGANFNATAETKVSLVFYERSLFSILNPEARERCALRRCFLQERHA